MNSRHIDAYCSLMVGAEKGIFGFDVLRRLGAGAGSVIYAVRDPRDGRQYALKHVVRATDKDIRFVEQLQAEHEASERVRHDGLRKTFELKLARNLLLKTTEAALVMELFDGHPLDEVRPDAIVHCIDIFVRTADALHALHRAGFVHCDLKPANILLNDSGEVKVIDLGQAVRAGSVKQRIQGTADYISPEQVRCGPVSARTDVFNLGATMYWALSGKNLPTLYTVSQNANSFLVEGRIDAPSALNPSVPQTLSNLVMECVRVNPEKRPESMQELSRRLEVIRYGISRLERGRFRDMATCQDLTRQDLTRQDLKRQDLTRQDLTRQD